MKLAEQLEGQRRLGETLMETAERVLLEELGAQCHYKQSLVADRLGISPRSLHHRLHQWPAVRRKFVEYGMTREFSQSARYGS